jgi:hypothetical protein
MSIRGSSDGRPSRSVMPEGCDLKPAVNSKKFGDPRETLASRSFSHLLEANMQQLTQACHVTADSDQAIPAEPRPKSHRLITWTS